MFIFGCLYYYLQATDCKSFLLTFYSSQLTTHTHIKHGTVIRLRHGMDAYDVQHMKTKGIPRFKKVKHSVKG